MTPAGAFDFGTQFLVCFGLPGFVISALACLLAYRAVAGRDRPDRPSGG